MQRHKYNKRAYKKFHQIPGALQSNVSNGNENCSTSAFSAFKLSEIQKAQEKKKFHVITGNLHSHDHTYFILCFIITLFIIIVFLLYYLAFI